MQRSYHRIAPAVDIEETSSGKNSVRLSVAAVHGLVPATLATVPVGTIGVVTAGLAVRLKQRMAHDARRTALGVALIVDT